MSLRSQLALYFVAVFAWTWGLAALLVLAPDWTTATFGEMSAVNPLFVAAVYGPTLVSVVLTAALGGRRGLARLFARLNPLRASLWWLLAVPIGMMAISAASGAVAALLGRGDPPTFAGFPALGAALTTMFILEPGPLGEELGWRGFALPRMLEMWSPLVSGLVLGAIWAIWHLPAFFISGTPQQAFALPVFILGATALSMLATWLYVRTAGSVLLSILLHRMANGANDLTGVTFEALTGGITVVALALVAFGGLRRPAPAAATHSEAGPGAGRR